MNVNNVITTKVMVVILFLLSILNDALPSTLTREELTACIFWDEFANGRCRPGTHLCKGGSDCCTCSEGTFMTWQNTCSQCLPFSDCGENVVLFRGNYINNRVCGDLPVSTDVPPTEDAGNLPSHSDEEQDDEQDDESVEKSSSSPPSKPSNNETDPPDDPPEIGTPTIKLDWHTVELLLIFIFGIISAILAVVVAYLKKCSRQKFCKCQCDHCRRCTRDQRGDATLLLPLHKKHANEGRNSSATDSGETSKMLAKTAHEKKKKSARDRKKPGQSS